MPLSVGNGTLTIVPGSGQGQPAAAGEPAQYEWRWYYHGGLAVLAIFLAPFFVLPENRRRAALWILAPGLFAVLAPRMLFAAAAAEEDTLEWVLVFSATFATAWAAVWLAGGRMTRWPLVGGAAIFAAAGVASAAANLRWQSFSDTTGPALWYGLGAGILMTGMAIAGAVCRRTTSRRLLSLALLAAIVPMATIVVAATLVVNLTTVGAAEMLLLALPAGLVGGLLVGTAIYLVNVPFLMLAFRSPLYFRRLDQLWWRQRRPASPFAPAGQPRPAVAETA